MSFTLTIRQGPARLVQRLPELSKSAFKNPVRSLHQQHQPRASVAAAAAKKPFAGLFSSSTASATSRSAFARGSGRARWYNNQARYGQPQQESFTSGSGLRKALVGGAIFGGTLVAINLVFNRETREDGGMPLYEREYLNNTFLHVGLGVGIIGLTARQMVQTGFVYRLMVTSPWVVAIGGLALSFGAMITTRSIAPEK